MSANVERGKTLSMVALIIATLCGLVLLAGCVAANEPASSNEANRANDGGEATQPAEERTTADQTATSTAVERATVPTHLTVTDNGETTDIRINFGDNGEVATLIRDHEGHTDTMNYSYDESGALTGGTFETQGETRTFTATTTTTKDGNDVEYKTVSTFDQPATVQAARLLDAATESMTRIETEYKLDEHGHVIEFDQTTAFSHDGKNYEMTEEASFNEDGLMTSAETHIKDLGGGEDGDFEGVYTYADDNRSVTKVDKRDDGSDITSHYELAYNEAGEIFRISGDGVEATIEYYETPVTPMAKAAAQIRPIMILISA